MINSKQKHSIRQLNHIQAIVKHSIKNHKKFALSNRISVNTLIQKVYESNPIPLTLIIDIASSLKHVVRTVNHSNQKPTNEKKLNQFINQNIRNIYSMLPTLTSITYHASLFILNEKGKENLAEISDSLYNVINNKYTVNIHLTDKIIYDIYLKAYQEIYLEAPDLKFTDVSKIVIENTIHQLKEYNLIKPTRHYPTYMIDNAAIMF